MLAKTLEDQRISLTVLDSLPTSFTKSLKGAVEAQSSISNLLPASSWFVDRRLPVLAAHNHIEETLRLKWGQFDEHIASLDKSFASAALPAALFAGIAAVLKTQFAAAVDRFHIPETERFALLSDQLTRATVTMSTRYDALMASLECTALDLKIPTEYLEGSTVELLLARDVAVCPRKLGSEIRVKREIDSFSPETPSALVRGLDSDLLHLLAGARRCLGDDNPERARYVSTSLRELLTHVLHRLASDEDVSGWTCDRTHVRDGRPTRLGRLAFITRRIDSGHFADFVAQDAKALLKLFDVLQYGTHVVNPEFSEQQLCALIARTEAWLHFVLSIARAH